MEEEKRCLFAVNSCKMETSVKPVQRGEKKKRIEEDMRKGSLQRKSILLRR
ncbi:MAG: hypothetical protein QXT26_07915 [Thermoproteota archaeon]